MQISSRRSAWLWGAGVFGILLLLNVTVGGFPFPCVHREPTFVYTIGFIGPTTPEEHDRRYEEWHQATFGKPAPRGSTRVDYPTAGANGLLTLMAALGAMWCVSRRGESPPQGSGSESEAGATGTSSGGER